LVLFVIPNLASAMLMSTNTYLVSAGKCRNSSSSSTVNDGDWKYKVVKKYVSNYFTDDYPRASKCTVKYYYTRTRTGRSAAYNKRVADEKAAAKKRAAKAEADKWAAIEKAEKKKAADKKKAAEAAAAEKKREDAKFRNLEKIAADKKAADLKAAQKKAADAQARVWAAKQAEIIRKANEKKAAQKKIDDALRIRSLALERAERDRMAAQRVKDNKTAADLKRARDKKASDLAAANARLKSNPNSAAAKLAVKNAKASLGVVDKDLKTATQEAAALKKIKSDESTFLVNRAKEVKAADDAHKKALFEQDLKETQKRRNNYNAYDAVRIDKERAVYDAANGKGSYDAMKAEDARLMSKNKSATDKAAEAAQNKRCADFIEKSNGRQKNCDALLKSQAATAKAQDDAVTNDERKTYDSVYGKGSYDKKKKITQDNIKNGSAYDKYHLDNDGKVIVITTAEKKAIQQAPAQPQGFWAKAGATVMGGGGKALGWIGTGVDGIRGVVGTAAYVGSDYLGNLFSGVDKNQQKEQEKLNIANETKLLSTFALKSKNGTLTAQDKINRDNASKRLSLATNSLNDLDKKSGLSYLYTTTAEGWSKIGAGKDGFAEIAQAGYGKNNIIRKWSESSPGTYNIAMTMATDPLNLLVGEAAGLAKLGKLKNAGKAIETVEVLNKTGRILDLGADAQKALKLAKAGEEVAVIIPKTNGITGFFKFANIPGLKSATKDVVMVGSERAATALTEGIAAGTIRSASQARQAIYLAGDGVKLASGPLGWAQKVYGGLKIGAESNTILRSAARELAEGSARQAATNAERAYILAQKASNGAKKASDVYVKTVAMKKELAAARKVLLGAEDTALSWAPKNIPQKVSLKYQRVLNFFGNTGKAGKAVASKSDDIARALKDTKSASSKSVDVSAAALERSIALEKKATAAEKAAAAAKVAEARKALESSQDIALGIDRAKDAKTQYEFAVKHVTNIENNITDLNKAKAVEKDAAKLKDIEKSLDDYNSLLGKAQDDAIHLANNVSGNVEKATVTARKTASAAAKEKLDGAKTAVAKIQEDLKNAQAARASKAEDLAKAEQNLLDVKASVPTKGRTASQNKLLNDAQKARDTASRAAGESLGAEKTITKNLSEAEAALKNVKSDQSVFTKVADAVTGIFASGKNTATNAAATVKQKVVSLLDIKSATKSLTTKISDLKIQRSEAVINMDTDRIKAIDEAIDAATKSQVELKSNLLSGKIKRNVADWWSGANPFQKSDEAIELAAAKRSLKTDISYYSDHITSLEKELSDARINMDPDKVTSISKELDVAKSTRSELQLALNPNRSALQRVGTWFSERNPLTASKRAQEAADGNLLEISTRLDEAKNLDNRTVQSLERIKKAGTATPEELDTVSKLSLKYQDDYKALQKEYDAAKSLADNASATTFKKVGNWVADNNPFGKKAAEIREKSKAVDDSLKSYSEKIASLEKKGSSTADEVSKLRGQMVDVATSHVDTLPDRDVSAFINKFNKSHAGQLKGEELRLVSSRGGSVVMVDDAGSLKSIKVNKKNAGTVLSDIKKQDAAVRGKSYELRKELVKRSDGNIRTYDAYTYSLDVPAESSKDFDAFLDNPDNWLPERNKVHQKILDDEFANARELSARLQEGDPDPTIYALRGNTASGKSTAVKNDDLFARALDAEGNPTGAINPDTYKGKLRTNDKFDNVFSVDHSQTHEEGSMLARKLSDKILNSDSSMVIDKRNNAEKNIKFIIDNAENTNKKVKILDVDVPLETSLTRVLGRTATGDDPLVPFKAVMEGFDGIRSNRQSLINQVKSNPNIKSYVLYATDESGVSVKLAEKVDGVFSVVKGKEEAYNKLMALADDTAAEIERVANTLIDEKYIQKAVSSVEPKYQAKTRASLEKYLGKTLKDALDTHAGVITPPKTFTSRTAEIISNTGATARTRLAKVGDWFTSLFRRPAKVVIENTDDASKARVIVRTKLEEARIALDKAVTAKDADAMKLAQKDFDAAGDSLAKLDFREAKIQAAADLKIQRTGTKTALKDVNTDIDLVRQDIADVMDEFNRAASGDNAVIFENRNPFKEIQEYQDELQDLLKEQEALRAKLSESSWTTKARESIIDTYRSLTAPKKTVTEISGSVDSARVANETAAQKYYDLLFSKGDTNLTNEAYANYRNTTSALKRAEAELDTAKNAATMANISLRDRTGLLIDRLQLSASDGFATASSFNPFPDDLSGFIRSRREASAAKKVAKAGEVALNESADTIRQLAKFEKLSLEGAVDTVDLTRAAKKAGFKNSDEAARFIEEYAKARSTNSAIADLPPVRKGMFRIVFGSNQADNVTDTYRFAGLKGGNGQKSAGMSKIASFDPANPNHLVGLKGDSKIMVLDIPETEIGKYFGLGKDGKVSLTVRLSETIPGEYLMIVPNKFSDIAARYSKIDEASKTKIFSGLATRYDAGLKLIAKSAEVKTQTSPIKYLGDAYAGLISKSTSLSIKNPDGALRKFFYSRLIFRALFRDVYMTSPSVSSTKLQGSETIKGLVASAGTTTNQPGVVSTGDSASIAPSIVSSVIPRCSISVSPKSVKPGEKAVIKYDSKNAASGTINNGIGDAGVSGEKSVSPKETTQYIYSVLSPAGKSNCSETVVVSTNPEISTESPVTSNGAGTGTSSGSGSNGSTTPKNTDDTDPSVIPPVTPPNNTETVTSPGLVDQAPVIDNGNYANPEKLLYSDRQCTELFSTITIAGGGSYFEICQTNVPIDESKSVVPIPIIKVVVQNDNKRVDGAEVSVGLALGEEDGVAFSKDILSTNTEGIVEFPVKGLKAGVYSFWVKVNDKYVNSLGSVVFTESVNTAANSGSQSLFFRILQMFLPGITNRSV
jgi:hypothetical protein